MREFESHDSIANQHLHLTGAMSLGYLREAATEQGLSLAQYGELEAKKFDEPDIWELAKHITSTRDGLRGALDHVVASELQNGVTGVELTLNPFGMIRRGMTVDEIVDAVRASAETARANGVTLGVRPGVNRKDGPETVGLVASVYEALPEEIALGIDLNGDERAYSTTEFIDAFGRLSANGIPVALHAGEFLDQTESLRTALRARPQRIGHAVAVAADPSLLAGIEKSGATIEVALTSNLSRGVVENVADHPIRSFVERGVPVVFGTDDPTFFGNTMSDEFALLGAAGVIRGKSGELSLGGDYV